LENEGSVSSRWVTRYCWSVSFEMRCGLLLYSGMTTSQTVLKCPFYPIRVMPRPDSYCVAGVQGPRVRACPGRSARADR
jgi:hypothetical protein